MKAGRLNWGLIFIIIGLVVLGWSAGRLPFVAIIRLVEYSPILLIAFGIQLIFSKSKAPQLAYLSSLVIIFSAVWIVAPFWDQIKEGGVERTYGTLEQNIDGRASALEIKADFTDRDFTLDDFRGRGAKLTYDHELLSPEIVYTERDGMAFIKLNQQGNVWNKIFHKSDLPRWKLNVGSDVPIDLDLSSYNGYCYLRMADLYVRSLDLDCEKCYEIVLQFGDVIPSQPVNLDIAKSKLRIEIPREHSIVIRDGVNMSSYLTRDLGFIESGEDLISDSLALSGQALILNIEPGLRELEINRR